MKVNNEKAIDVNNELKLYVDEKQDDIKHLEKQCDLDYEDDIQEITAALFPMKKKKQNIVCEM